MADRTRSPPERRRPVPVDSGHRRYFDPHVGGIVVKLLPGDHYVTDDPDETIATILGSCVAACIRDPVLGLGGMNHFMSPDTGTGIRSDPGTLERYGMFAMEALINAILARGGVRTRLEVKIFGGANVIRSALNIGDRNTDFVRAYLDRERMPITGADLGGDHPRRVHYQPGTGKATRLILRRASDKAVFDTERTFRHHLETMPRGGDVDLFE